MKFKVKNIGGGGDSPFKFIKKNTHTHYVHVKNIHVEMFEAIPSSSTNKQVGGSVGVITPL